MYVWFVPCIWYKHVNMDIQLPCVVAGLFWGHYWWVCEPGGPKLQLKRPPDTGMVAKLKQLCRIDYMNIRQWLVTSSFAAAQMSTAVITEFWNPFDVMKSNWGWSHLIMFAGNMQIAWPNNIRKFWNYFVLSITLLSFQSVYLLWFSTILLVGTQLRHN